LKVGISLPQLGASATRRNVLEMAKKSEQEGFDSLWVSERILWPLKPKTAFRGTLDGSFPVNMQTILDPLDTLTFVAANTKKIALGTSVINMLFRNPVILAKRFATLDILSHGRVICGLGIGWSKDEYQACNIPYRNRGRRADEYIQLLKKIWTDDIVAFKGDFYKVPASKIGPKPVQRPYCPIYLGGYSQGTFSRIVKYNVSGWIGFIGGPLKNLVNMMNMLKNEARRAKIDYQQFKTILEGQIRILNNSSSSHHKDSQKRFPLTGTSEDVSSDLQRIKEEMDIDHIVLNFNSSLKEGGKEEGIMEEEIDIEETINIAKQFLKFIR
jgi:probable F420-dependent oxidoreductase